MKKIILIIAAINVVLILFVGALFYLSEVYPFRPGQALFGLQAIAEDERINLTSDPLKKAEKSFELVERRLSDLTMVTEPDQVGVTVDAFDKSLTNAIRSIEAVPVDEKQQLYVVVDNLLTRVEVVLTSLEEQLGDEALVDLQKKVVALQQANSPLEVQKISAEPARIPAVVSARLIPFLDKDVDHVDFPLVGGHAALDCLDCHIEGEYANTPIACSYCHTLERDVFFVPESGENPYQDMNEAYPEHFAGECSDCHSIFHWDGDPFDHEEIWECNSCHLEDKPQLLDELASAEVALVNWTLNSTFKTTSPFHYTGDCSLCHQDTESWKEWDYAHNLDKCLGCHENSNLNDFSTVSEDLGECLRITECASCHEYDGHEENYGDMCTSCHQSFEHWLPAYVNHVGLDNCTLCHTDDKPSKHSNLMCSYCHTTEDWTTIIYQHQETSGKSCKDCHDAPDGHSSGACESCHTMVTWNEKTIFHTMENCGNCHRSPADHYPDLCISCHITEAWDEIQYIHDGKYPCSDCHDAPEDHYIGECDDCHFPTWWDHIDFDHTYYSTDCTRCHSVWSGHDWPGVCTLCHNTEDWYQIIYVHDASSDCDTCHRAPTGHWNGQCSRCHTTVAWTEIDFDHTGFSNCNACHTRPAGHSRGQCDRCHTTETWKIYTPTPTVTVTPDPSETPVPTETPEPTPIIPN
jgi:hypothetical protein